MRIHRSHLFGLAAVLVGSLTVGSGCVVEDDDGSMADHPEGGSSSVATGGAAGTSDDGVGGTSESGGEGGVAPTAGAAGATPAAGGDGGATPASGGAAGAEETGGAAGAEETGGAAGAEETGGAAGAAPAAGGAAGGTSTAGAGGVAGAPACLGDSANGGFNCNALPGDGILCSDAGGAGGGGGAADGLVLYGIDLCISLATDGRQGIAEAFYNCVNEISPAECSTAYDDAVVACQDSVTAQACASTEATAACGRIDCDGCANILVLWSDETIASIESCYNEIRTADSTGDCLEQLKDAEAGIGCD